MPGQLGALRTDAWAAWAAWAGWVVGATLTVASTSGHTAAAPEPGPAVAADLAAESWTYRIERGDTLIGLHARLMRPESRWQDVQRLNRIGNPRRLQPGSRLLIPLAMLRQQQAAAEVLHAHGQVHVESAGGRQALAAAATVNEGDLVVTGAQSSASLRFADGTRAAIGPDSRLRVERHARLGVSGRVDTSLRLDGGSVDTQVPLRQPAARVELRTPVVNLGVRGTDFRTRIDGDRTVAEVNQGRVAVGPQPVDGGFGTTAAAQGVNPPRPLLPAPDLGVMPARIERLQLAVPLAAAPGVQRYRLQVYDGAQPDRLLLDGLFQPPLALWPLTLPDGRYRLQARAADGDGIEGHDASAPFDLAARPEPPFLLRPRANEALQDAAVALAWSRNPEAARYRLQVSASDGFEQPLVSRDDLVEPDITLALPPGRYRWRVASVRADGHAGPWGDAQAWQSLPPPPLPPQSRPARVDDAGLVLSWSAAPQADARYQLQVADSADFSAPRVDITTERTEHRLADLPPGSYHVRVRIVGAAAGPSAFGNPQLVQVPEAAGRGWLWWLTLPLLLLLL